MPIFQVPSSSLSYCCRILLVLHLLLLPQTYIHMAAYTFTILWGIIRPSVCFKYSAKIRRALGP